ncbi:MAG: hypothetical protein ABIJ04_08780 [Bacteroidota bacterium]
MKVTGYNVLLKGVSGKLGDQLVFRQRYKTTVIASVPKKSTKPPTPAREKQMSKFRRAVKFAQRIKANPGLVSQYEIKVKRNQTIYHAALSAYMRSDERW